MTLRLLNIAQLELDDAITWYNSQAVGLGDAFLIEAIKVFRLIEQYPRAWHRLSQNTHRCRLARFPYGIIYTQDQDNLIVIAVAHLHRAPQYWRDRFEA